MESTLLNRRHGVVANLCIQPRTTAFTSKLEAIALPRSRIFYHEKYMLCGISMPDRSYLNRRGWFVNTIIGQSQAKINQESQTSRHDGKGW